MTLLDTLNKKWRLLKLSPVAKYLKVIARRNLAGIANLQCVSFLEMIGDTLLNKYSKSASQAR